MLSYENYTLLEHLVLFMKYSKDVVPQTLVTVEYVWPNERRPYYYRSNRLNVKIMM